MLWGWAWAAGSSSGLRLSVASTVVLLRALEERGELDSDATAHRGRLADRRGHRHGPGPGSVAGPGRVTSAAHAAGRRTQAGSLRLTLGAHPRQGGVFVVLDARRRHAASCPGCWTQVARTGLARAVHARGAGDRRSASPTARPSLFGVSFALGAFFAGVVLSEIATSATRPPPKSLPLQDAFAVLFFVSVGMLFDPTILVREPLAVLAVLLVIVLGKSLAAFAIVLAFGYPLGPR